ncbi:endo-1,4-beta-xylanase [Treponema zuelzerae]|uniref:Beta-xylanase n=1 Tax=Teretinema zuelzerae TaxID=156 RepID=A0AAE3EJM5_9SPIR|nr:endo-1,4-beta-xylanase [Teretinema zuelzerae]MCD1655922.1 endo-1,4-beta-xylanase [Teretinema zuelzerae]
MLKERPTKTATVSAVCIAVGLLGLISGCASPKNLHELASKKNLNFGVAIQAGDVLSLETSALLKEHFNLIVPENTMKWKNIRPTKTFWNWSDMDNMVDFAEKNGMVIRGHTFVWHQQNAPYVDSLKTKDEAVAMLTEQITMVMERYKGRVFEYDVANEVLNEDGTLRDTVWLRTIGPEYIDIAFKAARAADPKARLVLNDYSNEYAGTAKGDAFYELCKDMKNRGIPIDGAGLQLHLVAEHTFNREGLLAQIRRFAELGMFVTFTEIDVRIAMPSSPEKEAQQTEIFKGLMEIAATEPNTGHFVVWGYTDAKSWIPGTFPGYGSAHLFDKASQPKPVFEDLKKILADSPKRKK